MSEQGMDEIELMGAARPEVPPYSDAARAAARAALLSPSAQKAHAGRTRGLPAALRGRNRFLAAGLAVTGGASVTAMVLAVSGGGHPLPSRTAPLPPNEKSAFLIAADNAALQPTGRFWYTDQIAGQSYLVKAGYAITGAHSETFVRTSVGSGGGNLFYGRDLPARPLTAEDTAAWRKAGSPSSFRVWSNDHYSTYTTKAGSWKADTAAAGAGGRFYLPGNTPDSGLTARQLRNLPTDPATLAKMLFTPPKRVTDLAAEHPELAAVTASRNGPARTVQLASESFTAPLPPKVHAGLMRAIETQPGIKSLGVVTDPLGRRAVAVGTDLPEVRPALKFKIAKRGAKPTVQTEWRDIGYGERDELLFDEKTGAYLGEQTVLVTPGGKYRTRKPGFVIAYNLMRASGWADSKPAPPSALPFS